MQLNNTWKNYDEFINNSRWLSDEEKSYMIEKLNRASDHYMYWRAIGTVVLLMGRGEELDPMLLPEDDLHIVKEEYEKATGAAKLLITIGVNSYLGLWNEEEMIETKKILTKIQKELQYPDFSLN